MITINDIKRFNSKYIKGNDNECWEWTNSHRNVAGYGVFWYDRRNHTASRMSYCITCKNRRTKERNLRLKNETI